MWEQVLSCILNLLQLVTPFSTIRLMSNFLCHFPIVSSVRSVGMCSRISVGMMRFISYIGEDILCVELPVIMSWNVYMFINLYSTKSIQ